MPDNLMYRDKPDRSLIQTVQRCNDALKVCSAAAKGMHMLQVLALPVPGMQCSANRTFGLWQQVAQSDRMQSHNSTTGKRGGCDDMQCKASNALHCR